MGVTKKILGIEIYKDKKMGRLYLSQKKYIERVLHRFGKEKSKPMGIPLAAHFKFWTDLSPSTKDEKTYMSKVLIQMQLEALCMLWFAHFQIYLMLSVSLVSKWMI